MDSQRIVEAIDALPEDNALRVALLEAAAQVAEQVAPRPELASISCGPSACPTCIGHIEALRDKWHGVSTSGASYAEFCAEFCADLDALAAAARAGV